MTKISNLNRQQLIASSDSFLLYSTQNDDNVLVTGANMITSLNIVTTDNISVATSSKTNRVVSGNTTLTSADEVILADVSGGNFTINLALASTVIKQLVTVKKTDASINTINIQPSGTDLIDGNLTATLSGPNKVFFTFYSDGNNWFIIG